MRAVPALVAAIALEFVRDRTALFFTLAFPVIFMVMFGLLMGGLGGQDSYPVGLVVEDASAAASGIAGALKNIPVLDLTETGVEAESEALRKGDRNAVVIVPAGFGASLDGTAPAKVQILYDPSRQSTAQIVVPILERVFDEIDRARSGSIRRLQVEKVSVVSSDLDLFDFMAPGLIAMSVMQLGVFGSINLVVKREKLVLKRLGATPVSRLELVASEVIFRLFLTLVQASILFAIATLAFGVQVKGNMLVLVSMVIVGALSFIAIGFALSSFARTEEGILPIAQLVTFPMMFLSGIFFPVEGLPAFLTPVVRALPLTYLGDGVRQTMVGSFGINSMWVNYVALAGWLLFSFVVAVRFFKWE